jgi:hypothetical protein
VGEPKVTKEYKEDVGERDAEGFYDYVYRYWEYIFDFGDRLYRARIYTDEPEAAMVTALGSTEMRWSEAATNPDLRAIADHLKADVDPVEVRMLRPRPRGDPYDRVVFD